MSPCEFDRVVPDIEAASGEAADASVDTGFCIAPVTATVSPVQRRRRWNGFGDLGRPPGLVQPAMPRVNTRITA